MSKTISYLNNEGIRQEIRGVQRPIKLGPITTTQLGKCLRKGCQIYAVQVGYTNSKEKIVMMENIPIVQEFQDVFPEEIPGLPPK